MSTGGFVKGLVAGAAIGAVMGVIFDPVKERDRKYTCILSNRPH